MKDISKFSKKAVLSPLCSTDTSKIFISLYKKILLKAIHTRLTKLKNKNMLLSPALTYNRQVNNHYKKNKLG